MEIINPCALPPSAKPRREDLLRAFCGCPQLTQGRRSCRARGCPHLAQTIGSGRVRGRCSNFRLQIQAALKSPMRLIIQDRRRLEGVRGLRPRRAASPTPRPSRLRMAALVTTAEHDHAGWDRQGGVRCVDGGHQASSEEGDHTQPHAWQVVSSSETGVHLSPHPGHQHLIGVAESAYDT